MQTETVWSFSTRHYRVELQLTRDPTFRYDGDDENGETQAGLDSGDLVAFDSAVIVTKDGIQVGADHLGGSVYSPFDIHEFWQGHRARDSRQRNCSMNDYRVGHYFPDMVREAIAAARKAV